MASIYKISHEKVVSIRTFSSNLEKLHEVLELTVNVSADLIQKHKLEFKYSHNSFMITYRYWAFYHLDVRFIK